MTKEKDCPECGRQFAETHQQWSDDLDDTQSLCGKRAFPMPMAHEDCRVHTIERLKARVAVLEQQLSPRLRVWELDAGRTIWCVALDAEDCWNYLVDQHGDPDEIDELKANGVGWVALPDDKKVSICVDEDGDICGVEDGTPVLFPCWVWAAHRGPGFLAETE